MLSSYFLECRTLTDYDNETYDAAAGRLTGMLVGLLSVPESLSVLTHDAERETTQSEIEIMLEEGEGSRELVAKVVVDITGPKPVKFDKSKWTKMVKAHPACQEWPKMILRKKQVPNIPLMEQDPPPGI
jgi:hypothetical protein